MLTLLVLLNWAAFICAHDLGLISRHLEGHAIVSNAHRLPSNQEIGRSRKDLVAAKWHNQARGRLLDGLDSSSGSKDGPQLVRRAPTGKPGPKKETQRPATPAKPRPDTPAKSRAGTPAKPRPDTPAKPRPDTPARTRPVNPAKPRPDTPARTRPVNPAKPRPDTPARIRPPGQNKAPPQGQGQSPKSGGRSPSPSKPTESTPDARSQQAQHEKYLKQGKWTAGTNPKPGPSTTSKQTKKFSPEIQNMRSSLQPARKLERAQSLQTQIDERQKVGPQKSKPRLERTNSGPGRMDASTTKDIKPPRERATGGGLYGEAPKYGQPKTPPKKLPGNKLLEPIGQLAHLEEKAPGAVLPAVGTVLTGVGLVAGVGLQADWSNRQHAAGAGLAMGCIGAAALAVGCAIHKAGKVTAERNQLTDVDKRVKALELASQTKDKFVAPLKYASDGIKPVVTASGKLAGYFKGKPTLDGIGTILPSKPGFLSSATFRKKDASQQPGDTLVRRKVIIFTTG